MFVCGKKPAILTEAPENSSAITASFELTPCPPKRQRTIAHCNTQYTPSTPLLLASISAANGAPKKKNINSKNRNTVSKPSVAQQIEKQQNDVSSSGVPAGTALPLGIFQGTELQCYVWDGKKVRPIDSTRVDSTITRLQKTSTSRLQCLLVPLGDFLSNLRPGAVQARVQGVVHRLHNAFFPDPREVTPDYWEYARWRACHRFFSSMSSIFATQSLLHAVGVGAQKSLPAAASINWVLKDGLGRLGRLTVATRFGESFDSDLKRFRYTTSLLYGASLGLEYLTPLFPSHFLPMAALANIGKSVGLTTFIATQPAFHRSFARCENLADISAKAQAQQMAIDTMGLAVAVTLTALCRKNEIARRALPLTLFPFLVTGDLISIYKELRAIHLRTMNKERAQILAAAWVNTGTVPGPMDVSKRERLVLPPELQLGCLPLNICSLDEAVKTTNDVVRLLHQEVTTTGMGSSTNGQESGTAKLVGRTNDVTIAMEGVQQPTKKYLLSFTPPGRKPSQNPVLAPLSNALDTALTSVKKFIVDVSHFPVAASHAGTIRVALRCDAVSEDVMLAVLQTAHLRKAYTSRSTGSGIDDKKDKKNNTKGDENVVNGSCGLLECRAVVDLDSEKVLEESERAALKDLQPFVQALEEHGWQVHPFKLSSTEKRQYMPLAAAKLNPPALKKPVGGGRGGTNKKDNTIP